MFVFGVSGYLLHYSMGAEKWRTSQEYIEVARTATHSPMREICHADPDKNILPSDACEYHRGAITWAVLGDSHAVEVSYALAVALARENLGLKQLTFTDCEPTFSETNRQLSPCAEWTLRALDYLVNTKEIQTVVVTYRIHYHLFGEHDYPHILNLVSDENREYKWRSLKRILSYLSEHKSRVIFVLQVPAIPRPVKESIFLHQSDSDVSGVSKNWWNSRSSWVSERLHELPAAVEVLDPTNLFCDSMECWVIRSNTALYFDDDHPSLEGAKIVADAIVSLQTD